MQRFHRVNRTVKKSRTPPPKKGTTATGRASSQAGETTPAHHGSPAETPPPRHDGEPPLLSEELPTRAYLLLGADRSGVQDIARWIRAEAMMAADHMPLLITDAPFFAIIRDVGIPFEYLPSKDQWEQHRPSIPWVDMAERRLDAIYTAHHLDGVELASDPALVDPDLLVQLDAVRRR